MAVTAASISELLSTIRKLPPLPGGVARLLSLSPTGPSFFETSCAIVRAEPALATQVLKLANSALFAGQSQVTSVDRAMMRVGARMLSTTLTESHLQQTFDVKDETMGHLWLTNALSANLAMCVAQSNPALAMEPEVAYTFGLLHDVGRLVLVALYRNAAAEIVEDNPHPTEELVVVAAHHIPRAEREGYPLELKRTIDLMTVLDQVVHRLNGSSMEDVATASIEEMLDGAENEALLDAIGVRSRDIVDSIQPALAAVERQRKLLGLKASVLK
jgi:HD-like signal output (HDOD) protein